MSTKNVGIFVGSLRKGSFSGSIARFVEKQSGTDFRYEIIEIGQLPLYNQDYDTENTPAAYPAFREKVKNLDAFLFITPEHNRSVPAALKNALDVGSRPYGASVWSAKPGAVISNSPGGIGGFGANHHLRQTLSFLNIYILQQPEAYLSHIADAIGTDGELSNSKTEAFIQQFLKAFEDWITKFS